MQKPSQGDPTNSTTPTPKPQNHDPRTSQQNQPTTPPPKQQPGKPYQHKPDHTTQPTPAETTTTTNDHSNSQPHNRTRRSLNTHHTNVKSCPQQPHQRNHQNSHQPHTHKREAKNTHYTHPHHQHKPTKQPRRFLARICGYTKSSGDRPTSGPRTDHDQDRSASQSTHSLLSTADQGDTAT